MENQKKAKSEKRPSQRVKKITVTTELARELSIDGALLYSYLFEKLVNPYTMQVVVTVKEVEKEIGLNEYFQRKLLKRLEAKGLLQVVRTRSARSKRMIWFREINEKQLDRVRKRFQATGKTEEEAYSDFLIA
jgi:DNA-binding MarR family transcriptional regulator